MTGSEALDILTDETRGNYWLPTERAQAARAELARLRAVVKAAEAIAKWTWNEGVDRWQANQRALAAALAARED